MTTTVRSFAIASATGGAALSITGLGHQTGDLVICIVTANGADTLSDNNGATPMTKDLADFRETNSGQALSIFSRRVLGGDPATWSFTDTLNNELTGIAIAFQNPNATTIYDVAPISGNTATPNTNATTANAASITTLVANAIHVTGVGGFALGTFTQPSGYSLVGQGGANSSVAVATKVIASPSATGAQAWSWTLSERSIEFSFAIEDQGGGAVVDPGVITGSAKIFGLPGLILS